MQFEYTISFGATPEEIWAALIEPRFTRKWWDTEFRTDWNVGSTMTWISRGVVIEDADQVVLAHEPAKELSYTWHTMTDEMSTRNGISQEIQQVISKEPRSRVTYTLRPREALTELTVLHDGFDSDSTVLALVREGWPPLLGNLKNLLEGGSE
jgi:uncharacterized protein YndB with AHSA1/START domain